MYRCLVGMQKNTLFPCGAFVIFGKKEYVSHSQDTAERKENIPESQNSLFFFCLLRPSSLIAAAQKCCRRIFPLFPPQFFWQMRCPFSTCSPILPKFLHSLRPLHVVKAGPFCFAASQVPNLVRGSPRPKSGSQDVSERVVAKFEYCSEIIIMCLLFLLSPPPPPC